MNCLGTRCGSFERLLAARTPAKPLHDGDVDNYGNGADASGVEPLNQLESS